MKTAKTGDTVSVHYTGTLHDGTEFDSSKGREPLSFTLGRRQVLPGFDQAVHGMRLGDKTSVTIPAKNAYGEYNEKFVIRAERKDIPDDIELEIGTELTLHQDDGGHIPVRVSELTESGVVLDANHPLAGMDLTFEIELVEIT